MALSWSEQILPAGSQTVPVEIAYLDRAYIHLYVNNVEQTDFTWDSDVLIRFGTQLEEASTITIVRRTERSYLYIMFAEGAAFIKENLDTQNTQFLHLAQELVEGRAIEGFYGDISMNGYKITNLGAGTALTDAANVGQVQEVADRVTSLEQTVIADTVSYPWYTITTAQTNTISPPYTFNKAAVYINGVCQTPGYSYSVSGNAITLADPVPAGTHVFCRLGEDTPDSQGYATAASLATVADAVSDLSNSLAGKLDATANAVSATKLATARTIQTNLASTTAASFNGTANASAGVTGVLPVANGGTGANTAAAARTALGTAASGTNADITSLTNLTGGITGRTTAAPVSVVGEVLQNTPANSANLVTGANTNASFITLTPGNWMISGGVKFELTSATTANLAVFAAGFSVLSSTLPSAVYNQYRILAPAITTGSVNFAGAVPSIYLNVTVNTSLYLVVAGNFSAGTVTAIGSINAVRIS